MDEDDKIKKAAEGPEGLAARDVLASYLVKHNGTPAGRELMNQDVIRVYIANTVAEYKHIPVDIQRAINELSTIQDGSYISSIPVSDAEIKTIVTHGLRYWYSGKIEFTNDAKAANLYIGAFDEPGDTGIAAETLPIINDDKDIPNSHYSDKAAIIFSADYLRREPYANIPTTYKDVLDTSIHEVGHVFGIDHLRLEYVYSMVSYAHEPALERLPEQRFLNDVALTEIIRGR